jgi:hypothetical protein
MRTIAVITGRAGAKTSVVAKSTTQRLPRRQRIAQLRACRRPREKKKRDRLDLKK